jgi:hypothetical protein
MYIQAMNVLNKTFVAWISFEKKILTSNAFDTSLIIIWRISRKDIEGTKYFLCALNGFVGKPCAA